MRTQLSNNIVSPHGHENSCEVIVYQWFNVRHGIFVHVFKEVYQRTNFSHIIRYGRGKVACGFWVDWHMYRLIIGKNLKIFFFETARPADYRCLVVTYINPAIHAPGVYTSHGVIS